MPSGLLSFIILKTLSILLILLNVLYVPISILDAPKLSNIILDPVISFLIFKSPLTSNFSVGVDVPIPTLPFALILILGLAFARNSKSPFVQLPKIQVVSSVPVKPVPPIPIKNLVPTGFLSSINKPSPIIEVLSNFINVALELFKWIGQFGLSRPKPIKPLLYSKYIMLSKSSDRIFKSWLAELYNISKFCVVGAPLSPNLIPPQSSVVLEIKTRGGVPSSAPSICNLVFGEIVPIPLFPDVSIHIADVFNSSIRPILPSFFSNV